MKIFEMPHTPLNWLNIIWFTSWSKNWYAGLLCAIIYKQWVLNNGSLVNFINKIIIFVQLK